MGTILHCYSASVRSYPLFLSVWVENDLPEATNGHNEKSDTSGTKYGLLSQGASKCAFMTKVDSSLLKYSHHTEEAYQAVLEQTVFNPENRCKFLVGSRASCHICNDIRMFWHVYDSPPRKIFVGIGEAIVSSKTGTIELDDRIKLLNVLYVPSFGANVLSRSMLDKYILSVHFSNGEVIIGTILTWMYF
jgi:hypothetical protein